MNQLLFLLIFAASVVICYSQKNQLAEQKLKDVAYGTFASSKMDVYLPANRNLQTPFVILIHGGAWIGGDKIFESTTQDSLFAHGIASVNLNYRFADSSQVHYSQILTDIDSAVMYCIAHADEWHTRKQNFVVSGISAGGHLSLLYGYTTNKKISAIIAGCPPTDLTDTSVLKYESSIGLMTAIESLTGAKYIAGQTDAAFIAASPVFYIKNIPTLIIHGTADRTVPYSQAVELDKKLTDKNFTHQLISLPGADHDLNPKSPMTLGMLNKEIVDWVWEYGK